MKMRLLIGMAVVLFSILACAEGKKFTLKGQLQTKKNVSVTVSVVKPDELQVVDTIQVRNGRIDYSMQLSEPVMLAFQAEGERKSLLIFAENDAYQIQGESEKLFEADINGGQLYLVQKDLQKQEKEMVEKSIAVRQYTKDHPQQNLKEDTAFLKLKSNQEEADAAYRMKIADLIDEQSATPIGAYYALQSNKRKPVEEMKEALGKLNVNLKGSMYYDGFANFIEALEAVEIGKVAPDFTMNDLNEKPFTLSSLRGKYVLIDFWASWCGPCRKENPNVVRLYNQFKDKNFTILSVSLDEDKEKWVKAIDKDGLIWNHVSDLAGWNNAAAKLYQVRGVPHMVLLDPNGVIIGKDLRGKALYQKVNELFN